MPFIYPSFFRLKILEPIRVLLGNDQGKDHPDISGQIQNSRIKGLGIGQQTKDH